MQIKKFGRSVKDIIEAFLTLCMLIAMLPVFLFFVSFFLVFLVCFWAIGREIQVVKLGNVYHYRWFKLVRITKK